MHINDGATNAPNNGVAHTNDGKTNNPPFVPLSFMIEDAKPDTKVLDWIKKWKNCPGYAKALIAVQMGIKPYESGEFFPALEKGIGSMQQYLNSRLPDITSFGELLDTDIKVEPEVIKGIIRQGCKGVLGGPSKSNKTWALANLSVSIASGQPWIGFETVKGKVLYVNLELQDYDMKQRVQDIARARGIPEFEILENLHVWNLRKKLSSLIPPGRIEYVSKIVDSIVAAIEEKAKRTDYSTIIIDPTYKTLGGLDENKANDMTQLMGAFDRLANSLNCAVIFAAHFPKGDLKKRTAMDRISGSGVFARDPDAIITLSPLTKDEEKGTKAKDKNREEFDLKLCEMLGILRDSEDGITWADWLKKCEESALEIKKAAFGRLLRRLDEFSYAAKGSKVYSITEAGRDFLERYEE